MLLADNRIQAKPWCTHFLASSIAPFAQGILVLFTPKHALTSPASWLNNASKKQIHIANPNHAPYGKAATEALLFYQAPTHAWTLVRSNNVNQTMMFLTQGGGDGGFIAYAQFKYFALKYPDSPYANSAHIWKVPQKSYTPLLHFGGILKRSAQTEKAQKLWQLLRSPEFRPFLQAKGYLPPPSNTSFIQESPYAAFF